MPPRTTASAAVAGFALGLAATVVWSAEGRQPQPSAVPIPPVPVLDAVVAMPRTNAVLAMHQARQYLEENRPWAAWKVLSPHARSDAATAAAVMLAARAAAGWGGWDEVRGLLAGWDWLDSYAAGEGWRLLAEAYENTGRWNEAAEAHRRYLAIATRESHPPTHGKLARALDRAGRHAEAAAMYAAAAAELPQIADWLRVAEIEARMAAGAPDALRLQGAAPSGSAVARMRRAQVEAASWLALGDSARAESRLQGEILILNRQGAAVEAAELAIELARLFSARAARADARELLRAVAWESSLPNALRVRAANLLGEQATDRTASEELARAAAYESAGRAGPAARSLQQALDAGAEDDPYVRLRLGRLLFDAGHFAASRPMLAAAAEALRDGERRAEAELYAARARFRAGDRAGGVADLRKLVERRPGTAAAGSALFLLADAAAKPEEAIPLYRRAAAIHEAPEAREALFRLGDRQLRRKDVAAAIGAWEEYVGRYPVGEETARIAFEVAMLHQRAGWRDRATAMFAVSIAADPLSYYAVRSAERASLDPLAAVLSEPRPWIGLAVDPVEAGRTLARLDLLRMLGLDADWKLELDGAIRSLDQRPAALLVLAEGLRDRGHPVEAIRLGRRLLTKRDGQWDGRLLRVVFPLPYRDLLEFEADRYGVDPMLFAALIRQESTFRPAVRSRVGATGLSQIMPATGRWIAPRVGISGAQYADRLLEVPEINLRMGALYLGDMLKRYGGAADLALAGYNAGPGRADRWRRELGYDRDLDAFRDAIPFQETRHYVKIVLRNAAVYERLYRPSRALAEAPGTSGAASLGE
jgi:soluble lytic murein transglycosylase